MISIFFVEAQLSEVKAVKKHIVYLRRAQSILEYMMVIGIVALVLTVMGPIFKRGIQSVIKSTADQIGVQNQADQTVTNTSGYLVESFTNRRIASDTLTEQSYGDVATTYVDAITTTSNTLTNLGFTREMN